MLIDTYLASASSALAANVMVRYCFAGGEWIHRLRRGERVLNLLWNGLFWSVGAVMAARPMFINMGPQWACKFLLARHRRPSDREC